MSKFYGQVFGAPQTSASRRGHKSIRVSAQSYDGSIITHLWYSDDSTLMVQLEYSPESSEHGMTIFRGTIDQLLNKLA